MLLGSL
ncbi:hypothetical protein GQ607_005834 [Colletotrichum asianum]|nr:hypothetical protein GQ607_005834 [Colletotrichum asianum]